MMNIGLNPLGESVVPNYNLGSIVGVYYAITVNAGCKHDTYATEITNNEINGITYAAIVVYSQSRGSNASATQHKGYVIGDISGNKITNNATYKKGTNWAKNAKIECQGAIYVASYADVKGSIHHNTISTTYDDGIDIRDHATVTNINDNTINNAYLQYNGHDDGLKSYGRDVDLLQKEGYRLEKTQPYNLFPYTGHVETVCCLYHQKKDFISVPYEPKDAKYLKQ